MPLFKRALSSLQSVASAFLLLVANILKRSISLIMPRGNSKKRKNAAKETVTSTAGQLDNVRPPNPEESNLVARDPFDDAPKPSPGILQRVVHPSFHPGQPMPRMHHGPIGAGYREMPGMRPGFGYGMGPHHFPAGHMGMVRSPSYAGHPSCPNGYPMARNISYGMYRQRMMNGLRPGMPTGPMSDGVIDHGMIPGPGAHIGPLGRPTLTAIRRGSTGSSKNSVVEGKSPKIEPNVPKSKKKNDKKSGQNIKTEDVKQQINGMDAISSGNATPTPAAPKTCKICNQETSATDELIQCKASCGMWFHKTCTGLSDAAYKFLITEEMAIWCCDICIKTCEINAFCPSQKVKNSPTPLSAGA